MGRSGGRSSGNRTAPDAVRRATPRERDLIDPPMDRHRESARLTTRGHVVRTIALAVLIAICNFVAIVAAGWLGYLH